MRRNILLALIIAIVVAGTMQWYIPRVVETRIGKAVEKAADQVNYLDIDVKVTPASKVFMGRIDKLTIDAKELVIQGLPIAAFVASFDGVWVNPLEVLKGELVVQWVRQLRATVLLEEEGINQYFWTHVDPGKRFAIRLVGGFARLVGQVSILGRPIELTLNGKFEIVGPTAIEYVPTELVVSQTRIPEFLLDAVMQERRFIIDLKDLPVPVMLDAITVERGKVYVFGKERSPE